MTVDPAAPKPAQRAAGGLSSAAASALLAEHGPNTVPSPPRRGVAWRAMRQLSDPMLLLLMGAAVLTTWQGDVADTAVIVMVIVVNTAVGVAQELRAEREIAALRDMAAPRARVTRDGRDAIVDAATVVPGDLVTVEAGDVVPADATVQDAYQLAADESAVTGESLGVPKLFGDPLLAGTTLTRGRATALVTATGPASTLGRIADMVATARPGPTPLQRRLTRLGQVLTVAAVVVSGAVMVLALLRGVSLSDAALTGASLAVAAVPESLPAVLTLSLALGAHRMAQHAAIARELRAVETLGSVTLLATDKTGTLTENQMVVVRAWTPRNAYDVNGSGYGPTATITAVAPDGPAGDAGDDLARLARDGVLCNDADVSPDPDTPGTWRPVGDPTEAALVALATRAGLDVGATRLAFPRTSEVPFDSERAWMLTVHEHLDGEPLVVVKGAPDVLLPACADWSGDLLPGARAWAGRQADEGSRVLAVAEARGPVAPDRLPAKLALVGLVAMTDPPRHGLGPVLDELSTAGIELVVMTGDHPATAASIARQVGIEGHVIDAGAGDTLDGEAAVVYARVRPEHKLGLVRRWQQAGEVVAVTGDGVNDGPALRMADIGVAMGAGGTEVARQAADLVLTDDRLETVVSAVAEGRRIQDNLRRFLGYALSGGLAEVLYMLVTPFLGYLVPMLPGQILWVNMLTHGLPGVAMGAEPGAPDVLRRPPLAPDAPVIDRPLARRIAGTGTLIAVATTAAVLVADAAGADWRTSAFLVLGLAQLGVSLALRDPGSSRTNRFLSVAVAAAVLLMVAPVVMPPLQRLLETEMLPAEIWVSTVLFAAVPGTVVRLARWWRGRG